MTNSSRHSSIKNQNPVFVPSPRWLSESPANRGISGNVDYPGPGTSISDHSQTPSYAPNLRSPIPPPPANLYPGSPAAFNVDPGIPFLATTGPTEDGSSSDHESIKEELPQRTFGGALMSGIKHVVRRSLRDRTRSQQPPNTTIYTQPPQFRDSGYAESSPLSAQLPPPRTPLRMPEFPHESSPPSSRRTVYSVRPPSETLLGHQDDGDDRDEATIIGHQNSIYVGKQKWKPSQNISQRHHQLPQQDTVSEIPPHARRGPRMYPEISGPETIASPVSAKLAYDDEYRYMEDTNKPPSEISLSTYLKRFQQAVDAFKELPWIDKERITNDYFPERSRQSDKPHHHPAIVWRSEDFAKLEIPPSDSKDSTNSNEPDSSIPDIGPGLRAPRKGSYTAMNLDAEFIGNATQTPIPKNAPDMTPGRIRHRTRPLDIPVPPDSMLLQPGPPPRLPPPPVFPVPSSIHVTYERHPPNAPTNVPWVNIKVPQPYIPPPNTTNMQQPSIRVAIPSLPMNVSSAPPVNNKVPQLYIPPPNATNRQQPSIRVSIPSLPTSVSSASPAPAPTPTDGPADERIQSVGDSSAEKKRSSSRAHRDEWEPYPRHATGYVPWDQSEHSYGNLYGPGIHAARPPRLSLLGRHSPQLDIPASPPEGLEYNLLTSLNGRCFSGEHFCVKL